MGTKHTPRTAFRSAQLFMSLFETPLVTTGAINRRANHQANKLADEDRSVHDWYRFVLSFPAHVVKDYLARFEVGRGQVVLDPFCGTGTTLVECKKLGIDSVGIEANSMAYLASSVKTDWEIEAKLFKHESLAIAEEAFRKTETCKLEQLSEEGQKLILKDSISAMPLHKCLVLKSLIDEIARPSFREHYRLALAHTIVFVASNLHFGPEVGISAPKNDADVVGAWLNKVAEIADDIETLRHNSLIKSTILHQDSRSQLDGIAENSIDAVFTSPPYPNEKDYTRTTRLESVILGLINSRAELQALKRTLLRSNTRNVYKGDVDDQWISQFPKIIQIADNIETRRIELGKNSGFERLYPRVTKLYFGGMARHFAGLRSKLKPGALLGYVVGDQASYLRVMIRTGQLLTEIAQDLGYELVGIDLFRTRIATATKEQLREEVVLLRWPG